MNPSAAKSESSVPGPQKRGTGGTLNAGWKRHRDQGHPPSEVLRAGLRALEQDEREDKAKLEALRAAVLAGEQSGVAEGDVMAEMRERIRRRALVTGRV